VSSCWFVLVDCLLVPLSPHARRVSAVSSGARTPELRRLRFTSPALCRGSVAARAITAGVNVGELGREKRIGARPIVNLALA
jgi:hypothetical protein